jgi:hypothetical protein
LDGEAVAGEEPLGVEPGHRLQRGGPILGVALHLLRIAAVRRLPDDQVAGEEQLAARHPHPQRVVGLALRGREDDVDVAQPLRQPFAHQQRREREPVREERHRQPELPHVDARVQAVHEPVAVEAVDAALLRDDGGRVAGREEGVEAEGVIGVAVRVHGGRHRRVGPGAHGVLERVARLRQPRVDEQQPARRAQRVRVHERRMHEDVGRDLAGRTVEARRRRERIGDHHRMGHGARLYRSRIARGKA